MYFREHSQEDMLALVTIADGNPGALSAIMDLRDKVPDVAWQMCMMTVMALDIKGTQLYLLYNDVCKRDALAMARYLYAIRTGAAPLGIVRSRLHALATSCDASPEQLQLHPLLAPEQPWMEDHVKVGQLLFGADWRWEGL